jgi:hypothetical protein
MMMQHQQQQCGRVGGGGGASSSSSRSSSRGAAAPRAASTRSRRALRVHAVSHDPENLFKGSVPQQGLIERRLMAKQMQVDQKFAAAGVC